MLDPEELLVVVPGLYLCTGLYLAMYLGMSRRTPLLVLLKTIVAWGPGIVSWRTREWIL